MQKGSTITQPRTEEEFGSTAVRISSNGQRLAVAARYAYTSGFTYNGCIYVYDFDGTAWQLTVSHFGTVAGARIGYGLAMSSDGTTIAAGGTSGGIRLEVFKYMNGSWNNQVLTGAVSFGSAVGLNVAGDVMAVGVPSYNIDQGRVYTYMHDGITWNSWGGGSPTGRFGQNALSGFSVALATVGSTTTMVIGAYLAENGGTDRG